MLLFHSIHTIPKFIPGCRTRKVQVKIQLSFTHNASGYTTNFNIHVVPQKCNDINSYVMVDKYNKRGIIFGCSVATRNALKDI